MGKKFLGKISSFKSKYKKHALIALSFLLVIILFGNFIKPVFVIGLLIIVASLSTFYHNYMKLPFDFELVKISTVLSGVAFGAIAGLFVGISSVTIGRALSGRLDQDTITSLLAISVVAVLASIFKASDIVRLGMILVIVYYLVILPFIFMFGKNILNASIYILSNIVINYFLFSRIAPVVLRIIT